jgi:hypothetical protein
VPRWRDAALIISTKFALIDSPPLGALARLFPGISAAEWAKRSQQQLLIHYYNMVAFSDAWDAITERWAAGDWAVRAIITFSLFCSATDMRGRSAQVMQPTIPNPWIIVILANAMMSGTASEKETEYLQIQGASGGPKGHGNVSEVMTRFFSHDSESNDPAGGASGET